MYTIKNESNSLNINIKGVITDEDSINMAVDIRNAIESGVKSIILHINSYGGSVLGAWEVISALKSAPSDVIIEAINEGFAISAASVLLAAANISKAFSYSSAMIHDPLIGGVTLADAEGSDKEFLQSVKDGIMSIYQTKMKDLSPDAIANMMAVETSMNAAMQLKNGLVDEVITSEYTLPKNTKNLSTLEIYNIYNEIHLKKENNMENTELNEQTSVEETNTEIIVNATDPNVDPNADPNTDPSVDPAVVPNAVPNVDPNADPNKPGCELNMEELNSYISEIEILVSKIKTLVATPSEPTPAEPATPSEPAPVEPATEPMPSENVNTTEIKNLNNVALEISNSLVLGDTAGAEKIELANKIFKGIGADHALNRKIKLNDPELFEELHNIFYGFKK